MTEQTTTEDKRALLARMLKQKKEAYSYPLSYGQQALWFIYQNAPNNSAYNMAWPVKLKGSLNVTVLQSSLQTLVDRHPALRTTIDFVKGELVQTVKPTGSYHWQQHETSGLSEQQRLSVIKTAYEKPFNLSQDQVLRADLFQINPQETIFLLTMHHILGDATSMNILSSELFILYEAKLGEQSRSLPLISASYADFVQAETVMINSLVGENLMQYWQKKLGNESPLLNLPADYPRPALQSYNGASVSYCLPAKLSDQLTQLARQEKSTLFSLFLTAFQILLQRYTGQTDIWIGTPSSTYRSDPIFENLVGYLVNPVVMPAKISPNQSFYGLLEQNKQTVLEAIQHAAYPFPLLVKSLQPKRDTSYAPVFQVMLDFKPAALSLPNMSSLSAFPVDMPQMEGQFDLTLTIKEGELEGCFNYNQDLFKSETIKRMAQHFQCMLTDIVNHPQKSISYLQIMDDKEIQQLQAWNNTAVTYPGNKTIIDLFEQQVAKTSDNIALVFEDQPITYRQLNEKVNQLAHYLLSLKTREGILLSDNPLIAICVERSVDMVIGLLAILKAGGAYVPIAPDYPKDRIEYMLADSAAPVLLTQSYLQTDLVLNELEHECVLICLDKTDFSEQLTENPQTKSNAQDLAYVIYTSGSTGKPKGAMNAHTGIVNRLLWMQQTYQITALDRILQKTPFSFDVSVWEVFWPLITGATVVVAKPEGHKDPEYLSLIIAKQKVTVMHFVPSMLQVFLNHANIEHCSSLKTIICSGEALSVKLVQQFFAQFTTFKTELYNLYGPTEAAVDVSYWKCKADNSINCIPIGKPVANTQLYVLDKNQQIVPMGVPGELYIGGIQVGRGYLNQPKLTAKTFIEVELFGKTQRVYKTGDLVRWLPDGTIEYLERLDSQIKRHGLRIELGEIESVILQFPNITASIVVVRETDTDHQQLVAYIVSQKAEDSEAEITLKLKQHLQNKLPDYMIPSIFMLLEAIPLSPNGKVDRKALPEPDIRQTSYIVARDSIELRLAQLWEKLFDISPINVQDDFFAIGGDSLLAIRLISHIKTEFETSIPLQALFQYKTIEQLGAILRKELLPSGWSPMVCLQPKGKKPPLFFAHASGGSAFNYVAIAALMGTERPFYAIHPRGIEPGESFHDSIEEMAADYVSAMRKIQPQGPYFLAGWSFGGTVIFEMARILEQAGETAPLLLAIDMPEPLANVYKEDDVEFLMDRVPHYHGVNIDELNPHSSNEEKLAYLLEQIKMAGLFTPDIDRAHAMKWFNLYKHHNKLVGLYKPRSSVNSKIIMFKPSEKIPFDDQMGDAVTQWKPFVRGGIEVYESPGNHFNMVSPVNTPALVKKMKEYM